MSGRRKERGDAEAQILRTDSNEREGSHWMARRREDGQMIASATTGERIGAAPSADAFGSSADDALRTAAPTELQQGMVSVCSQQAIGARAVHGAKYAETIAMGSRSVMSERGHVMSRLVAIQVPPAA